jgi:hypothetical protein
MKPENLNWVAAYVGFKNHFINSEEILQLYYQKRLRFIDDKFIVQLEVNKDSPAEFLSILEEITIFVCKMDRLDIAFELEKAEKFWHISFLKQIANSPHGIQEKLIQIENLWADFGYPREWETFIYYMPNKDLINKNEESVYQNFLKYLDQNI